MTYSGGLLLLLMPLPVCGSLLLGSSSPGTVSFGPSKVLCTEKKPVLHSNGLLRGCHWLEGNHWMPNTFFGVLADSFIRRCTVSEGDRSSAAERLGEGSSDLFPLIMSKISHRRCRYSLAYASSEATGSLLGKHLPLGLKLRRHGAL